MRKVLLLEQIGLIANVKLYFFKISWGLPPRPPSHLPPQNGMEEHPKCTILKFKCQNFPPQTPREPTKNPPPPTRARWAMEKPNFLQENQDLLQAFSTWTTLTITNFVFVICKTDNKTFILRSLYCKST